MKMETSMESKSKQNFIDIKVNEIHSKKVIEIFNEIVNLCNEEIKFWNEKVDYEADYGEDYYEENTRELKITIMNCMKLIKKKIDKFLTEDKQINISVLEHRLKIFKKRLSQQRHYYEYKNLHFFVLPLGHGTYYTVKESNCHIDIGVDNIEYLNFGNIYEDNDD